MSFINSRLIKIDELFFCMMTDMGPAAKTKKTWTPDEQPSHASGIPCVLCVCVLERLHLHGGGLYKRLLDLLMPTGEKLRLLKEKLARTVAKQQMKEVGCASTSSSSIPLKLG